MENHEHSHDHPHGPMKAHCFHCKTERTMKHYTIDTKPNGRRFAKGPCEVCGTNMAKSLPSVHTAATPA